MWEDCQTVEFVAQCVQSLFQSCIVRQPKIGKAKTFHSLSSCRVAFLGVYDSGPRLLNTDYCMNLNSRSCFGPFAVIYTRSFNLQLHQRVCFQ